MGIDEVAKNLVAFAFDFDDIKTSLNEMPFASNINKALLTIETTFLRAFAVNFAITFITDNDKMKKINYNRLKGVV